MASLNMERNIEKGLYFGSRNAGLAKGGREM
jgi:hypothetical protein